MANSLTFEEALADVRSELVSLSSEYASGTVSDVYVFASTENGSSFFDPFFVAGGQILGRAKLPEVDTSIPR